MCCACCFIQKWMARPHILAGTSCLSLHRPNMVIRVRVLVMCQCKLRFADIVAVVVAQHRQPAKTKQQSIGGNLFAAYNASFSVSIRGRTSCGAQKECIPLTHWRNSPISYIYICIQVHLIVHAHAPIVIHQRWLIFFGMAHKSKNGVCTYNWNCLHWFLCTQCLIIIFLMCVCVWVILR